jgi:hypothetical protein
VGRDDHLGSSQPSRSHYHREGRIVALPETAEPHSATGGRTEALVARDIERVTRRMDL